MSYFYTIKVLLLFGLRKYISIVWKFFLNYFLPIGEVGVSIKKDEEQQKLLPTRQTTWPTNISFYIRSLTYIGDQWKQFSILVIEMFDTKISILSIPARVLANGKQIEFH